jgi:hypothetical protein
MERMRMLSLALSGGRKVNCFVISYPSCTDKSSTILDDIEMADDDILKGRVPLVKSANGVTLRQLSDCKVWVKDVARVFESTTEDSDSETELPGKKHSMQPPTRPTRSATMAHSATSRSTTSRSVASRSTTSRSTASRSMASRPAASRHTTSHPSRQPTSLGLASSPAKSGDRTKKRQREELTDDEVQDGTAIHRKGVPNSRDVNDKDNETVGRQAGVTAYKPGARAQGHTNNQHTSRVRGASRLQAVNEHVPAHADDWDTLEETRIMHSQTRPRAGPPARAEFSYPSTQPRQTLHPRATGLATVGRQPTRQLGQMQMASNYGRNMVEGNIQRRPWHMSGGPRYGENQIAGPSRGPHARYVQEYDQGIEYMEEDSYGSYERDGEVYTGFENDF